ncbi:hypothetical protein [Streptomyces sp. NPDC003480]
MPGNEDLDRLAALDATALGRGRDAQQLLRALQGIRTADVQEDQEPVSLSTIDGRAWRLEPNPNYVAALPRAG